MKIHSKKENKCQCGCHELGVRCESHSCCETDVKLNFVPSGLKAYGNKARNFGDVDIVARDAINEIMFYLKNMTSTQSQLSGSGEKEGTK